MITTVLGMLSALVVVVAAGHGALGLLSRGASHEEAGSWPERAALVWLLGIGYVSLALAVLGAAMGGAVLIAVVAAGGIALFVGGRLGNRGRGTGRLGVSLMKSEWFLLALLAAQFAVVLWTTARFPLGWDGLTIWDMKAQIAFANDGRLPLEYFRDATRSWSHVHYPLYWPYAETWFYLCIGGVDQTWIRAIGAVFYAAAVGLLVGAIPRLGGTRRAGMLAAAGLFFLPMLTAQPFGVFAGYADFPLAVVYLAAVCRLPLGKSERPAADDRLLGVLAMLTVWTKTEGKVLLGALLVWAGVMLFRSRQWRRLLVIAGPAVVLLVVHAVFLRYVGALPDKNYFPPTPGNVLGHLDRTGTILGAFAGQFIEWRSWSLLWPGAALALASLWAARQRVLAGALVVVLVLPMPGYALAYVLSTWPNYERHIQTSLSRLLLGLAPVALLAIGMALSHPWRRAAAR